MNIEVFIFPLSLTLSVVGIYLNLCYQRATHRSTVYARFLGRNLRFLSLAHIFLAFSNIIFTAAMWGTKTNRSKKSEAFFSTTLSLTRALPAATIFWVTVERIMFNRIPSLRENVKTRYIVIFRSVQLFGSMIAEMVLRGVYENSLDSFENLMAENGSDDPFIRSSLIENPYYDYYHGSMFLFSIMVMLLIFNVSTGSYTRALLLGGMRNDQKIQNLKAQNSFFKRSYIPLYVGCFSDFSLHLLVKRGLSVDDPTLDVLYLLARSYLPIVYPISLIAVHKDLRADFIANFFLCRKARNLHKESKVKVIATRESQESIIANLKMIGILSDVDTVNPGAVPAGGPPTFAPRPSNSSATRSVISKDPMSNTSMGSLPKTSSASAGVAMMFHTRPKNSVPSVGSVG
ncbi:unnamed protein product [Caenorhabditis sp. 36 PRJEB53466]|nr:unnamed protein product [Caenorhabditis sp. 36 PRJEB53466]